MRALISVWDKTGIERFASGLADLGCELVASGGTAAYLEELALAVTPVEELTNVPELLGGRVKTLHPAVHAGILARRDRDDDLAALDEHAIEPFDVVCVNLYPFERAREIEMIDVGGPAMLRAAAKNWAHVAALSRPEQYEPVLMELRLGSVSEETRRRLAADAFAATAAYDAAVARWLRDDDFPPSLTLAFDKVLDLPYGENPHQRASYYAPRSAPAHVLSGVEQVHGKPLSYNNLSDLAAARLLLRDLDGPACVIVKHANPCAAAEADTVEGAYDRALACDPLSAYGGVVALDRPVSAQLAEALARQFVEVLLAPECEEAALAALRRKPGTRVLRLDRAAARGEASNSLSLAGLGLRSVAGGLLVQQADAELDCRQEMEVVCGELADDEWDDVLFAWRVCKHVSSNAIVVARNRVTLGIGAGQQSRVDAVRLALDKARDRGHDATGSVLASDAFFPFPDAPLLALAAGARAIVQPGGSKRDAEVVDAVAAAGAAMVFTGVRHFRH
ncbi:MAG: bifunctional phosphoribosylaminoimidazolecarboxamide formyltransferase/IMP cyclohydrolase [Actinomycetota bacterium]|nr:bifunctional phosphoribosylaminoimidazolecarboxamide formyltransferase/IMP cyclohydrolase [Actinomycetota bacterium]